MSSTFGVMTIRSPFGLSDCGRGPDHLRGLGDMLDHVIDHDRVRRLAAEIWLAHDLHAGFDPELGQSMRRLVADIAERIVAHDVSEFTATAADLQHRSAGLEMREQETPDLFVARAELPDQLLTFFGVAGRIRGRINHKNEAAGSRTRRYGSARRNDRSGTSDETGFRRRSGISGGWHAKALCGNLVARQRRAAVLSPRLDRLQPCASGAVVKLNRRLRIASSARGDANPRGHGRAATVSPKPGTGQ